jgi:UDP-2,4-diacetamido-2,4,6-trideoxy-beta-L-altropyranose hydrolase
VTHLKSILFRCDGTTQTGLGHVSRCLAFSEALEECGFNSHFYGWFEAGAGDLLDSAGVTRTSAIAKTGSPEDNRSTILSTWDHSAAAVVVDSYCIDEIYIEAIKSQNIPVVLIDDFGLLPRYTCWGLINFCVSASKLNYPCLDLLCLLGPQYLLARRGIRALRRNFSDRTKNPQNILVSMGGMDHSDLTLPVVKTLLKIAPDYNIRVVVGKGYKRIPELDILLSRFSKDSHLLIQLSSLAGELAWADLCICGGGLTKYEAAYVGIPSAVISQNIDQARETAEFTRKGLAFDPILGHADFSDGLQSPPFPYPSQQSGVS